MKSRLLIKTTISKCVVHVTNNSPYDYVPNLSVVDNGPPRMKSQLSTSPSVNSGSHHDHDHDLQKPPITATVTVSLSAQVSDGEGNVTDQDDDVGELELPRIGPNSKPLNVRHLSQEDNYGIDHDQNKDEGQAEKEIVDRGDLDDDNEQDDNVCKATDKENVNVNDKNDVIGVAPSQVDVNSDDDNNDNQEDDDGSNMLPPKVKSGKTALGMNPLPSQEDH